MHKYVVAVSGGADSVVLLDMLAKQPDLDLVVAHFDHGIRKDSARDAMFVETLARKYKLPFETRREELGENASEELARDRRYDFLRSVAKQHGGQLVTAHHSDDVVETVVINLLRGTGWRGLAVMDSDIVRPLTHMSKPEIIKYARDNVLQWREDSTNQSDAYLRNKTRKQAKDLSDDDKRQILALWSTQKELKKQIENEAKTLLSHAKTAECPTLSKESDGYSRYFFTHVDEMTGIELLRHVVEGKLMRPQLKKTLHAIKTAAAGKTYLAGGGVKINFTSRNFTVELLK